MELKGLSEGKYILVKMDEVLSFYASLGYDIENGETETPNVVERYFFTGNVILKDGFYCEIVMVSDGFDWKDVEDEDENLIEF